MFENLLTEHSFHVHCPQCDEKNTIKLSKEIKCKKCDNSFSGKTFFKKLSCTTFSSIAIGATLGVGGTLYSEYKLFNHIVENSPSIEEQRIPIPVEKAYKLVQSCISNNRVNYSYYTKKIRDNCFCAVEKLSETGSIRFLETYSSTLQNYYNQCSNQ